MEKKFARYLRLNCGHLQTLETFDQYICFRPKRGWTYCENCDDFVKISQPLKPPDLPMEPMF